MYQLIVYVPQDHLAQVKQAIFDAGAGRFEQYEHCCWQTKGEGQFKPLLGSNPAVGEVGQEVEQEPEYKIETICREADIHSVIQALKHSHPYEEPAYAVWALVDI